MVFRNTLVELLQAPGSINFKLEADPLHLWEVSFDGTFTGGVSLTFAYDPNSLAVGCSNADSSAREAGRNFPVAGMPCRNPEPT